VIAVALLLQALARADGTSVAAPRSRFAANACACTRTSSASPTIAQAAALAPRALALASVVAVAVAGDGEAAAIKHITRCHTIRVPYADSIHKLKTHRPKGLCPKQQSKHQSLDWCRRELWFAPVNRPIA